MIPLNARIAAAVTMARPAASRPPQAHLRGARRALKIAKRRKMSRRNKRLPIGGTP
jgi:hypothetical protein